MKVAIIGGGLFGIANAIKIKENFPTSKVEIFEKKNDILMGASGKNQFRWHRGYHYPRSQKTISECLNSYSEFKKYFGKAKIDSTNYYAIAKDNSRTSFDKYLKILTKNNLEFKVVKNESLNQKLIEGTVRVNEELINIEIVRKLSKKYLKTLGVKINLNKEVILNSKFKKNYDFVILSTYENNNHLLKFNNKNKFQLVEKIIVKTPKNFKKQSFVILDGNFMCIDPYQTSKFSVLGHVNKSIHKTLIDYRPRFEKEFNVLISNYHNSLKPFSKFNEIKKDFNNYFNGMKDLEYKSSFFVIRCTRPFKEKTDERLSEFFIKDNVISIFSGKWVSCFKIFEKVFEIIK